MDAYAPSSAPTAIPLFAPIRLQEFLDKLTQLGAEYGLAISDEPHLFIMEPDDRLLSYAADDESRLILR